MHLRRLEAHGFKAFADRQTFDFGPGLTVIVGPNGSGKSNVSDAIRWALGETSARQIRARKTEDVIFSGSDRRRQMGAAEVSITLDNAEGWMPIEFGEVTVTRRAFRSGENEYLINGQKVRLGDVTDLFRRARVGQNSYAMMSQGLVDEVLAMRPSERRDLIEEAANVRRHRQQLTLSERRLTETRDNLGRVRMLIREVEPRIRQLQRQTSRAQRYRELASELQEAQLVYFDHELRAANEALASARAAHDQHTQAFRIAQQNADRVGKRLTELNALATERREALEALQAEERRLAEAEMASKQQIALTEQRLELLAARRAELEAELASLEAAPDAGDEGDTDLSGLEAQVLEARGRVEREREALRSADEAARVVLRELSETQSRRARLDEALNDARRRIEELQQRQLAADAERRQAEANRERLLGELRELGQRALTLRREGQSHDLRSGESRTRRERAEAHLEEQLRQLIEARDALRAAESALRQHEERAAMLERLAASVGVAGGGAEALLDAPRLPQDAPEDADGLRGVIGAVISLLRVPSGLDQAIEAALAEQVSAIVVESEDDAVAALGYLRDQSAGTATVYPLDKVPHQYPLNLFNERGVVGVAARLVRCEQRYRPLIDTLLGRIIVVDDLATAQEMVQRGLGSVVTRDGTLLRPGGAYFGGRVGAGSERFSLQRELEELPERRVALDEAVGVARGRLGELERVILEARSAVDEARTSADTAEEQRRTHEQEAAALRRRQAGLNGEMGLVRRALAQGAGDASAVDAAIARRDELERDFAAAEASLTTLRDRSDAVGAERDAVAERVTAAVTELAAIEGTQRAAIEQREERAEARRRAREQLAQRREQLRAATEESQDLELSLRGMREGVEQQQQTLALAQAAVEPAREALGAVLREEQGLQDERQSTQAALLTAERSVLESENALRQTLGQLQRVQEQMRDDGFELDEHGLVRAAPSKESAPSTQREREVAEQRGLFDSSDDASEEDGEAEALAAAGRPIRGGAEVSPVELRKRISELRGEIRSLGPVNVEAIEDLSAEQERYEFLKGQVEDLETAEADLRQAIEELRKLIAERFRETFAAVATAFSGYFERFFGGGAAELRLLEGEDGEEAGVEISAQPPGKRVASLAVLSGGERSLTSVALLFALLSVNPAPVCVLDEVDAALDEANVGRFVDTLKELTDRSQFIVISHNRRTIEAADAIYGVSMADDSTSRVLSLRLADLPQAS
ncbi:MAG: chromosome segregation protein SMC [Dehalococcoidia bacterium]